MLHKLTWCFLMFIKKFIKLDTFVFVLIQYFHLENNKKQFWRKLPDGFKCFILGQDDRK